MSTRRHFLKSLRRKALAKLERYPHLVPRERIESARTLYDFNDAVTAPVHGFSDANDYYTRSSSIRFLPDIRVRTLLLNAIDDPFLPRDVLHQVRRIAAGNHYLEVEFPATGGHVGFVSGAEPASPVLLCGVAGDRIPGARVDDGLRSRGWRITISRDVTTLDPRAPLPVHDGLARLDSHRTMQLFYLAAFLTGLCSASMR